MLAWYLCVCLVSSLVFPLKQTEKSHLINIVHQISKYQTSVTLYNIKKSISEHKIKKFIVSIRPLNNFSTETDHMIIYICI